MHVSKLQKIAVVFLLIAVITGILQQNGRILCAGIDGTDPCA